MQYYNICNLRHLGMVKLKHGSASIVPHIIGPTFHWSHVSLVPRINGPTSCRCKPSVRYDIGKITLKCFDSIFYVGVYLSICVI